MNKKKIIVGARGSKLAIKYAEIAIKNIKTIFNGSIELKKITTKGDLVLDRRTSDIGGKGEFIKNIEHELINNKIDIAVHSLKDIPSDNTKGLVLKSFLKRNYPNEVLISNGNLSFKNLKRNSIVGTSSPRREFQIRLKRPDLIIKLIRGNIDTRISMLRNKNYDAIILAKAGISSLNLENLISEEFHCREIVPSAGQGIIALQAREKDYNILEILEKINHPKTEIMGKCEREVLKILGGDCNTAIGVNSKIENQNISIIAELFSVKGNNRYFCEETGEINMYLEIAKKVAGYLKTESNGDYKL